MDFFFFLREKTNPFTVPTNEPLSPLPFWIPYIAQPQGNGKPWDKFLREPVAWRLSALPPKH